MFNIQIDSASSPCADFYFRSQQLSKFGDLSSTLQSSGGPFQPSTTSSDESPFADLESALSAELTLIVLWRVSVHIFITLQSASTPFKSQLN